MELIWAIRILIEQITNEVLNYWKHPCYLLNILVNQDGKDEELEYILIPLLRPGQKQTCVDLKPSPRSSSQTQATKDR